MRLRGILHSLPPLSPRYPQRCQILRPLRVVAPAEKQCREMPVVKKEIELTPAEHDLFTILKETTEHYNLGVTLRCAGGWVRDKLLGKNSDDIDVAIDTMLGATFAEKVNGYLMSRGEKVHAVAVIETNPEQSKHLETARIKIHGIQVDLVNLRSETYTQTSRVPQMDFGTPTQDAYRRDLTINSMFYNINASLIEDFTENGLEDLKDGWIRTPLLPTETFMDDPLRVLRSVRFAARFSFRIDPQLLRAAKSDRVREALNLKVSRERIGAEVDGMFNGPDPVMAVQHLVELTLFPIVFLLPDNLHFMAYGQACLSTLKVAFQLLQSNGEQLTKEERRLYLLAAMLVPIQLLKGPHASGKGARHFCPASAHVIWEGLRWRNKDSRDVGLLHEQVPKLIMMHNRDPLPSQSNGNGSDPFEGNMRVELGMWMRQMKGLWKLGVLLAPIFSMHESLPLGIEPTDYVLHDFVHAFNRTSGNGSQTPPSETQLEMKRLELCGSMNGMIYTHGVEHVCQQRPLLDGKSLMAELSMTKGGPILGLLLDLAAKWQLANPHGTKEECVVFLKEANTKEKGCTHDNVNL